MTISSQRGRNTRGTRMAGPSTPLDAQPARQEGSAASGLEHNPAAGNPNPAVTVADRLRAVRAKAGLSAPDFADRIRIARSTYLTAERNERDPSPQILRALHKAFQIDLNWILEGEDLYPVKHRSEISAEVLLKAEGLINSALADGDVKATPAQRAQYIARAYRALANDDAERANVIADTLRTLSRSPRQR